MYGVQLLSYDLAVAPINQEKQKQVNLLAVVH